MGAVVNLHTFFALMYVSVNFLLLLSYSYFSCMGWAFCSFFSLASTLLSLSAMACISSFPNFLYMQKMYVYVTYKQQ